MADPKIRYDIEAGITGEADVEQLAQTVRTLGNTLEGDLKTKAAGAADALDNLAAKKAAVTTFAELKRATVNLTSDLNTATAAIDRMGQELPQAAQATQAYAEAEKAAGAALTAARADLAANRAAHAELRAEVRGSARDSDTYREATAALATKTKELQQAVKDRRGELATATAATKSAQTEERALTAEYDKAVKSAGKLSSELGEQRQALTAARGAVEALGVSSQNLTGVQARLDTAISEVRAEVTKLAPAFASAANASTAATTRQISEQRALAESVQGVQAQLSKIQGIASAAFGGSVLTGAVLQVAEVADGFKNLEARVKLATGEGQLFTQSFRDVQQVALDTHSPLEETATLFARITDAGKAAGLSAQDAAAQSLGLTQTINQAVQLSGSGAEASSAAITQLIQALQSGVLRGEEFNSIMEQAPRLAQALAAGLGTTTGALRGMAEQGQLTTAVVVGALQSQSATVQAEFAKLPATVGRSLQDLQTRWMQYVGATDNGFVSSANLAKVIDGLANNLDVLVSTLIAAGKAYAAIKIAGLAADAYRWATSTATATTAIVANTAATTVNTVATTANSAAKTAAAAANAEAWRSIAAATTASGASQAAAVVANTATTASMAGQAAQVAKTGVVWRAAAGMFGPYGLAVAALAPEIIGLAQGLGEGAARLMGYGKMLDESTAKMRAQELAAKEHAAGLALVAQQTKAIQDAQFGLTKEAAGLVAGFETLRKGGDSAAEAIAKIGKDFDLSTVPGVKAAGAVLDKLRDKGLLTASEFEQAWANALKTEDLQIFEVKARAAFQGTAREAERMAAVFDATAREAIRRAGLEFDSISGGASKASLSAISDTQAIIASLGRLKAEGVDTGLALTASISKGIQTADGEKALAALRVQIESVRSALGDRITDGLLERAAQRAQELKLRIEELKPGIQSATEAMAFFGLKSSEALQRTAQSSREAYDTLKASGLASADQLRAAFERTANDAIAANRGIAPSWIPVEDAITRARQEVESFGRTTSSTLDDLGGRWRDYGNTVRSTPTSPGGGTTPGISAQTGNNRAERLAGQNAVDMSLQFKLRDQLRAGTLTSDDAGAIRTVIDTLKQQNEINGSASRLSAGFMSLEGARDAAAWQATRAQLEQTLARLEAKTPALAAGAGTSTTHKVELTLPNGSTGSVNVASDSDAKQLVQLLAQIKGRST